MNTTRFTTNTKHIPKLFGLSLLSLALYGCGSDDDSGTTYVKFYNASANSPAIYLTIDEDPDSDDSDLYEQTVSGIEYGSVTGTVELETNNYFIELAWQDNDSSARDDLEIIYEDEISTSSDSTTFIVMTDDVEAPSVYFYNIPVISDEESEEDSEDDLFNLRVLNMVNDADFSDVDVYLSKSNETFNEAELLATIGFSDLTDNLKLDQDEYTVYLTKSGEQDVLFTSEEITYSSTTQYMLAVRSNGGSGESPYVLDWMASSSVVYEFNDKDAEAQFQIYNGIDYNEQLSSYNGLIDINLTGLANEFDYEKIAYGSSTEATVTDNGDYSVDVRISDTSETLQENHLLTLPENAKKTLFFYLEETSVDEDGDGDVDEDGDGEIDEIEVDVRSLAVTNSQRQSIYDHQITAINLVDNDDYSSITVYYVRSDEVIETAEYSQYTTFGTERTLTMLNNTYLVYAVAREGSSDIILETTEITLDEDSGELFLIIDEDPQSASGYQLTFTAQ